jgi:hypothetical protein
VHSELVGSILEFLGVSLWIDFGVGEAHRRSFCGENRKMHPTSLWCSGMLPAGAYAIREHEYALGLTAFFEPA